MHLTDKGSKMYEDRNMQWYKKSDAYTHTHTHLVLLGLYQSKIFPYVRIISFVSWGISVTLKLFI